MKSAEATQPDAIRFGTDGWRAVIADGFTFANLERVSQAYADYINQDRHAKQDADDPQQASLANPLVIIGYDRRFLSNKFAVRTSEVIAGNDLEAFLFPEDVPTPLVSWAVREENAAGGIVITASHNPAEFNGFKIKASWGGSATSGMTAAVESLVDAHPVRIAEIVPGDGAETARRVNESYRRQISNYVDLDRIRSSKIRVVIDPMHGSGGNWVESFLLGGSIDSETIRSIPAPLFGGVNPEPVDRNLACLKTRVKSVGALIGLATDGDADRLGAVNELGCTMTMHEVVPILLVHLIRNRQMDGGVVRTFSQSVLIKRIASAHGLKLYETPIGFKYVADLMLSEDILIGAEESGGIGVKGHIPERDGILNSLLLLEAVIAGGQSPSELVRDIHREFGEFFFDRRDVQMEVNEGRDLVARIAQEPPNTMAKHIVIGVETLDGTKLLFADESWLLFRQSGTEPVLRIYCEAPSLAKVNELLTEGISVTHGSGLTPAKNRPITDYHPYRRAANR